MNHSRTTVTICDHDVVRAVTTGYDSPDLMVCEDCGVAWNDPLFTHEVDDDNNKVSAHG